MVRFEMDVSAADLVARTIEGVLVPFDETAVVEGVSYSWRPHSARIARARTPLLVDHDRKAPVGVLAEVVERDDVLLGRFKIDATPEGDTALVQAASGSRGSLSVGAALDDVVEREDGVVEIVAGRVFEVSLLALGAFESAAVTRVAAEADDDPEAQTTTDDEEAKEDEDEDEDEDETTDDDEPTQPEEEKMEEVHAAAPPPVIRAERDRPERELNAGEMVSLIVRAQHGEPDARRYIEAALVESISTDVSGLLPPTYETTVIGGKPTPRPLYDTFRSRPLPGVGLAVNKPKWTTRPNGAWAANVDADATSTKVVIGSQAAAVQRWDWAGAIPWVVVQRSDPSIIDEIYREAVEDFYLDVETSIAALLAAAATDTSTSLGAAVGKFYTTTGRTPEAIIVAPDVWGKMADRTVLQAPVAGAPASASGELSAGWGGIPITVSGALAPTFAYLVTRRAIDARVTEPVRLTANAIGALNVELAVVGEGLFDTDYPGEIMELAPTIPLLDEASTRRKAS